MNKSLPRGIIKRGETYWANLAHPETGRMIRRSLKTKDLKTAEKLLNALRVSLVTGEYKRIKKNPPVQEIFDNYAQFKRLSVTPDTALQMERYFESVLENVSTRYAHDLTKQILLNYLMEVKRLHSNKARKVQVNVLAAYKHAFANDVIEKNPLEGMILITHAYGTKEPLTESQYHEFAQAMQAYTVWPLILFLMKTGCRFGEAAKLKWRSLDLEEGVIVFEGATTKTRRRREVPMSDDLRAMLQGMQSGTFPDMLVFGNGRRNPFNRQNVNRDIRKVGQRIGRPDISLHTLRHTFINLALDAEVDLFTIQRIVGHSTIRTTELYLKPNRKRSTRAVEALPTIRTVG